MALQVYELGLLPTPKTSGTLQSSKGDLFLVALVFLILIHESK